MIKKRGTSWRVVEEYYALFIGFFMWAWFIFGTLLYGLNYSLFILNGPFFILSYMIIKIIWAIKFDNVLSKKN